MDLETYDVFRFKELQREWKAQHEVELLALQDRVMREQERANQLSVEKDALESDLEHELQKQWAEVFDLREELRGAAATIRALTDRVEKKETDDAETVSRHSRQAHQGGDVAEGGEAEGGEDLHR